MSLVKQFDITLKDFLPDPCDGMIVRNRGRGTTTIVNRHLYARLRASAVPLDSVVEQLHDEIHRS
jgi:hypothetical protein